MFTATGLNDFKKRLYYLCWRWSSTDVPNNDGKGDDVILVSEISAGYL